MPKCSTNGIHIEYDTFGKVSSPPLVLIMGLGGQMILWEEQLCRQLAKEGLYVIRFDNRDVGLTSKIENKRQLDLHQLFESAHQGKPVKLPYTLDDMAADVIGLLDSLSIKKAHICGASMGGMIAQILAIKFPARVSSLISISSTVRNLEFLTEHTRPDEFKLFSSIIPQKREANIDYTVNGFRELTGPGFDFDEAHARRVATELFDRSFYPAGVERQLIAAAMTSDRKSALKKINIPALVIHGDCDPLIPVTAGRETAETIPGAKLMIIKGMGHDIPRKAWPALIGAISGHIHHLV